MAMKLAVSYTRGRQTTKLHRGVWSKNRRVTIREDDGTYIGYRFGATDAVESCCFFSLFTVKGLVRPQAKFQTLGRGT